MDLMRCSIAALCTAAALAAQAQPSDGDLVRMLRGGGFTLYLRHASTDLGQQDTQGPDFADCAKQRNLDAAGRRQSRAAGEAIRKLGLPVGEVIASPYCRALETATLAFGRAERSHDVLVRAGPGGRPDYGDLLRLVSTPPAPGTLRIIVAHNAPHIAYLREGEAAVIRPIDGGFEVVAQVEIDEWARLARTAPK